MELTGPFTITTDAAGKVSSIRAPGWTRSMPALGSELEAFTQWAKSVQNKWNLHSKDLPRNATIVFDAKSLIEECKHQGVMLYAQPGWFFPGPTRGLGSEESLINLERAIGDLSHPACGHEISQFWTIQDVKAQLDNALANDSSPARRISSLPIERTFVYIDVSDFSKHAPIQQALIINSLVGLVNDQEKWRVNFGDLDKLRERCEAGMCIGDGYIFVFKSPVDAVNFAGFLAYVIERGVARRGLRGNNPLPVEFHFRMGAHCGPVYTFWDPGRQDWNYIGDGINGGNRVLSAMGKEKDDAVFISGQLKDELIKLDERRCPQPEIRRALQNKGRHADKHGNMWRVYELNAMQVFDNLC